MSLQLKIASLLWVIVFTLSPVVVFADTNTFPERVAAKCTGEASFAVPECACTVKNRLDVGWSEAKVLDAYYAPSISPTTNAISITTSILNEETECNKDFYFMLSLQDTYYLGLHDIKPAGKVVRVKNVSEIWLYPRSAWEYVDG